MKQVHSVVVSVVLAGALVLGARSAYAEDVAAAAKAFAQAQEVMLAGDVARAADLYELADELAPSAPALRNAARARLGAKHFAMAATHAAELLRRYPSDKESRTVAEAILSMLTPQLAQFEVSCVGACTVQVDGRAVSSSPRELYSFFTQPGARTIIATFEDGRKAMQQVTATLNHASQLKFEPPAKQPDAPVAAPVQPAAVPASPERRPFVMRKTTGISRAWVLGGTLVTLGLGATAVLQGMATLDTRDEIEKATAIGTASTAMELYDKGRDQQLRTNILIGAAAAAGVTTVVLAVFTNWSPGESRPIEVSVVPVHGGMGFAYGARF